MDLEQAIERINAGDDSVSGTVVVTVGYGAFSNVSYRGERTFEYDAGDWANANDDTRHAWIDGDFVDWLTNDVGYSTKCSFREE